MIQIHAVDFTELKDPNFPHLIRVAGKLKIVASMTVDRAESLPQARTELKRMIWWMVYNDLRNPLDELIERALIDADLIYRPRVEELANQLKTLLALPK